MNMLVENLLSGKSILRPRKPLEGFLEIHEIKPFGLTPGTYFADDLVNAPVGAETKSVELKRCAKMASGCFSLRQCYEGFSQPEV